MDYASKVSNIIDDLNLPQDLEDNKEIFAEKP